MSETEEKFFRDQVVEVPVRHKVQSTTLLKTKNDAVLSAKSVEEYFLVRSAKLATDYLVTAAKAEEKSLTGSAEVAMGIQKASPDMDYVIKKIADHGMDAFGDYLSYVR